MKRKNIILSKSYDGLLQQIVYLLNNSFLTIKKNYLVDCQAINDLDDKRIEIRLNEDQATVVCTFDNAEICNAAYLFTDKEAMMEEVIFYLVTNYNYDYIDNQWFMQNYVIEVNKNGRLTNDVCLKFTPHNGL